MQADPASPPRAAPRRVIRKLLGIQYLRAIAALGVVAFHATERTGAHFWIGAAGVDIFFVISGFIMWTIAAARPLTPAAFIGERIRRIAPLYWTATLVMAAGAAAGLFPNLILTMPHLLASLSFLPAHSPSNGQVWPVLVQGWTLNYEMAFYAVFALSLFLTRYRIIALTAVFITVAALPVVLGPGHFLVDFYGRPIILEFLLGIFISRVWLAGIRPPALMAAGFVLAGAAGFVAVEAHVLPYSVVVLAPSAGLLLAGVTGLESAGHVPAIRPLAYLGDASYSIYLWHTFAVSVAAKLATRFDLAADVSVPLSLVAGTLCGIVAYEVVERPLGRLLKRRRAAVVAASVPTT